jgi:hypothetical protein
MYEFTITNIILNPFYLYLHSKNTYPLTIFLNTIFEYTDRVVESCNRSISIHSFISTCITLNLKYITSSEPKAKYHHQR